VQIRSRWSVFTPAGEEDIDMVDRRQEDINAILQCMHHQHSEQPAHALPVEEGESRENETEPAAIETIHVYFVRESEREDTADKQVVESTVAALEDASTGARTLHVPEVEERASLLKPSTHTTHASLTSWIATVVVMLLLLLIAFQVLLPFLTPTPTITLAPIVRDLPITATMVAAPGATTRMHIPARQLTPLTLIQSTTAVATGKGHQDARSAMGTITFFNGLFTSQTIAAGTTLTGSDGVQVVTDQLAVIPAAWASTPPTYGQVTVSAHALYPGAQGNIPVHDVNQTCCMPSVLAQNTNAFHGGQRERDYTVVTSKDIDRGVAGLTTTLIQSAQAAFTAQLTAHEALVTPDCKRTMTADHQAGAEAAVVTVAVSEQCTAIAYDAAALREGATRMFTYELARREGIHYRLLGAVKVSVLHARFIDQKRGVASLTVHMEGTWMYRFSQQQIQRIRQLVAGKTASQAVCILLGLPGIQRATIEGLGENGSLPKDSSRMKVLILSG
jgi:hypothetical protein